MRTIDVKHDGLGKFRRLAGFGGVEQKAAAQQQLWDQQWQRRHELERKLFAGANGSALQALKKIQAEEQSEDARRACLALASILLGALRAPPSVDWAQFTDSGEFCEPEPAAPAPLQSQREPREKDFRPASPHSLLELLHTRRRRIKPLGLARSPRRAAAGLCRRQRGLAEFREIGRPGGIDRIRVIEILGIERLDIGGV